MYNNGVSSTIRNVFFLLTFGTRIYSFLRCVFVKTYTVSEGGCQGGDTISSVLQQLDWVRGASSQPGALTKAGRVISLTLKQISSYTTANKLSRCVR